MMIRLLRLTRLLHGVIFAKIIFSLGTVTPYEFKGEQEMEPIKVCGKCKGFGSVRESIKLSTSSDCSHGKNKKYETNYKILVVCDQCEGRKVAI